MALKLKTTGLKWTRQAQWGFRLFDFWCSWIGVAVEVDGATHDAEIDAERDLLDWNRSAIVVVRVLNWNEDDAKAALIAIGQYPSWNIRRAQMGKAPVKGAA